jgi:uncharacterized metal-binding protein
MSSCSVVPVPGRGVEPPLSVAVNGTTGSASSILEIPKKVSVAGVAGVAGVAVVIVAGCTIDCVNTVIDKIEIKTFQFF